MKFVDAHAHITDERFENVDEIVENAKEKGVDKIVCSAFNMSSSVAALNLAQKYQNVFANVGIHPENVEEFDDKNSISDLEKLARDKNVVAIGEIGLDYHYFEGKSEDEISKLKNKQKEIFAEQINLANKLGLPIVVHSRDAMGDTLEVLKKNPVKKEGLMHCYGGSVESAKILMNMNFSFSFGGVVTFNNAKNVREVVEKLPMGKILLETDCPYMTPVPFRGQRNEPKNVVYVADMISRIKNISIEEVAEITTKNAERVFGL